MKGSKKRLDLSDMDMDSELITPQLVNEIMNIGELMVKNGAESGIVEHRLQNVFKSYGAKSSSVYALPSKIELSVVTGSDQIITEIRKVKRGGRNYELLENVNAFAKRLCLERPDAQTVHRELEEEIKKKALPDWAVNLGTVLIPVSFSIFYSGSLADMIISGIVCAVVIVLLGNQLQRHSTNQFLNNFVLTLFCALLVIVICSVVSGSHPDRIMLAVIMVLISGLDMTNGIGDVINNNVFSGMLNLSRAMVGALAIVFGAIFCFAQTGNSPEDIQLASNLMILILSGGAAVFGFGLYFHAPFIECIHMGIGGLICTAVYALTLQYGLNEYICVFGAALSCAAFSLGESRWRDVPATVFLSTTVLPLVPGASMYYMLLGMGMKNADFTMNKAMVILQTGLAITIGFMTVQVAFRDIYRTEKKENKGVKNLNE